MSKWPKWREDEIAALEEMATTCTIEQVAKYLDRSPSGVKVFASKRKISFGGSKNSGGNHKNPFSCTRPRSILIARTCFNCGEMRDEEFFQKQNNHWHSKCNVCKKIEKRKRTEKERAERAKEGVAVTQQRARKSRLVFEALQAKTLPYATRSRFPYSSKDIEILEDSSISTLSAAIILKRSWAGVSGWRGRNGVIVRPAQNPARSKWAALFPEEIILVQEEFRKLGIPEEEWMWND